MASKDDDIVELVTCRYRCKICLTEFESHGTLARCLCGKTGADSSPGDPDMPRRYLGSRNDIVDISDWRLSNGETVTFNLACSEYEEYSIEQAAKYLSVSTNQIQVLYDQNELVGYPFQGNEKSLKLPKWQFFEGKPLEHLSAIISILEVKCIPAIRAIQLPLAEYDGLSILNALRASKPELAAEMARYYKKA